MRRPRDSQRSALYRWERALPGWPGPRFSLADCQGLVNRIWHDAGTGSRPEVRDGRGRRHACYCPSTHQIRLPRWSRSRMIVLHEIAHALLRRREDLAWHGPEFAGVYLDLLVRHAGVALAEALASAGAQRPRKVRVELPARVGSDRS